MLDNLARVLQLNPVERIQLFRLARREPAIDSTPQRETVSPRFQRMLDQSDIMPSFVMGRRWDVLGWNRAARAFFLDFEQVLPDERNMVWLVFTHPALRLFGRRMVDTGPGHASQVPWRLRPLCRRLAFSPACGPAERCQSGIRTMVAAP